MKNMRCRGRQRAASCDFFPSEERKKEKGSKGQWRTREREIARAQLASKAWGLGSFFFNGGGVR